MFSIDGAGNRATAGCRALSCRTPFARLGQPSCRWQSCPGTPAIGRGVRAASLSARRSARRGRGSLRPLHAAARGRGSSWRVAAQRRRGDLRAWRVRGRAQTWEDRHRSLDRWAAALPFGRGRSESGAMCGGGRGWPRGSLGTGQPEVTRATRELRRALLGYRAFPNRTHDPYSVLGTTSPVDRTSARRARESVCQLDRSPSPTDLLPALTYSPAVVHAQLWLRSTTIGAVACVVVDEHPFGLAVDKHDHDFTRPRAVVLGAMTCSPQLSHSMECNNVPTLHPTTTGTVPALLDRQCAAVPYTPGVTSSFEFRISVVGPDWLTGKAAMTRYANSTSSASKDGNSPPCFRIPTIRWSR